jgi:HAD superfamily hydrolase (TIGR01549 family)
MNRKFANDYEALGFSKEVAYRAAQLIRNHILDVNQYQEFDDTRATLELLSAEGWRNVILSNNHPDLEELVRGLGLDRHFTDIITSGKVGFEKPRAELFHYALEATGSKRSDSWMVGDNINADVLGAEAVGLRAILVRSAAIAPRYSEDLNGAATIILAD